MARIKIVVDNKARWLSVGSHAWRVTNEDEYYAARRMIRDAINATGSIIVWVTNARFGRWFDDLYEEEEVELVTYDPRRELADALQLSVDELPLVVDEQLCEAHDLITEARRNPPHQGEGIVSWILRTLMGEPWGQSRLSFEAIGQVLTMLANDDAASDGLNRLVVQQLHRWSRGQVWPQVWAWLSEDCSRRARCLLACWATSGYGGVQRSWLTQEGYTPEETNSALQLLQAIDISRALVEPSVSHRLRQIMKAELADRLHRDGVPALEAARSHLHEEIIALTEYLRGRAADGKPLSSKESDRITDWVKPCQRTAGGQQAHIMTQLLRDASLPGQFPGQGDWHEVKQWLTDAYLPAYRSRAVTSRLNELSNYVMAFEEWFIDNYHRLHMQERIGPHRFADDIKGKLKHGAVLLLLMDGAPYPAMQHLLGKVRGEQALTVHEEQMFLALLPSTTTTNKQSILVGQLPDHAIAINEEVIATKFGISPQQVSMNVIDDPTALTNFAFLPGWLYVVHYRTIDQSYLHKPMAALKRWTESYLQMEKVGEVLRNLFTNATQQDLGLWVGCISDHGWSELPASASQIDIPETLLSNVNHGRVLTGIADEDYGWALEPSKFFITEACTLAKGYGYFGRCPQGAVHGGATPQEVATLGVWLANTELKTFQKLVLQVQDRVVPGVVDNQITLRIINPNEEPVQVHKVSVPCLSIEEPDWPVELAGGAHCDLCALCDASSVRADYLDLSGNVTWDSEGQRHTQSVALRVPTVRAAQTVKSFEDMFRV